MLYNSIANSVRLARCFLHMVLGKYPPDHAAAQNRQRNQQKIPENHRLHVTETWMDVVSGIFGVDGGRHLVDAGVLSETVAELHAVMPSAPSCCDRNRQDDKRQGRKRDEEGLPFPVV